MKLKMRQVKLAPAEQKRLKEAEMIVKGLRPFFEKAAKKRGLPLTRPTQGLKLEKYKPNSPKPQ